MRDSSSLNFKPSQIAASALMLALNIFDSPAAKYLGYNQINGLAQKSHYFDKESGVASPIKVGRLRPESSKQSSPSSDSEKEKSIFSRWNSDVQRLTNKKIDKDITVTYKTICNVLIEREEFADAIKAILSMNWMWLSRTGYSPRARQSLWFKSCILVFISRSGNIDSSNAAHF